MNNIDELERHLDLLNEVLNRDNESDANEDELYERRIEVRRRMAPFYRQRADIFDLFDDNQIYKVQYPPQVLAHPLPILVFKPARDRPYGVSRGNFLKILILIVEPSGFFHQKDKEFLFILLIFI